MTRARFAIFNLSLLFLGLLGMSLYTYESFPTIIKHQAIKTLHEYGVDEIEFKGMHLSSNRLKFDKLRLLGEYEGYAYDARLSSLEVHYDWRMLISRQVQTVTLSVLDLGIEQKTSSPDEGRIVLNLKSILQENLIERLPLQELRIREWSLDYRSQDGPVSSAKGNLLFTGQLELLLESALAGGEVTVTLRTGQHPPTMNMDIALRKDETDISRVTAQLQAANGNEWEWRFQGEWQDTALLIWLRQLAVETDLGLDSSLLENMMLVGSSKFTAQVRHPDALSIPRSPGWSALQPFDATIHIANTIRQLDYPGIIQDFAGNLDTTAVFREGTLRLAIEPFQLSGNLRTVQLSLPEDMQHWLRWKETVPVHWESREPVKIASREDGKWYGELHNTLLVLGDADTQIRLETLHLDATLAASEPSHLDTDLSTTIETRLRKQQLPQFELAIKQQGNVKQNAFSMVLKDTAQSIKIGVEGTLNLVTGSGYCRLIARSRDLPHFAGAVITPLRQSGLLHSGVEIRSGSLALDTTFERTDAERSNWTQQSQFALHGLSGSVDEYQFENLGLEANWSGIKRWKTLQPVELSLVKLDLGFEVHDIAASITLPKATVFTKPSVNIEKFSAGMFGGQLFLPKPAFWDFGAPINTLTLKAQQWQLSDIVALQQDTDIQASGILEGELPVTVDDGRIVIKNGYLRALPPGGSIRYIRNNGNRALGETSRELELALDLLSDFQYQVLSSAVELDKEGNLQLGLSLAGHNPNRYEGRPINFNMNLEQNLDPLLQSLRLSDKLVKKIENRLQ